MPSLDAPAGRTLPRAGSLIHYWLHGDSNGPVIALTHGASMDHRMFDPQIAPLVEAGYRVLTWDVRGHGKSKPLGSTPISVGDMSDDLMSVLDDAGIHGQICIGGQSMGGYIAQDLVLRFPERVAAVVIVGSTCTTASIPWWERWALRTSTGWLTVWPWNNLKRAMAKAVSLRPAVREYAYEAESMMTKHDFIEVWRGVAGAIHPQPGYRITVPLLLTHGDQDKTGNIAKIAPAWARREPHCRYEVIPDAAHNANQDNPEAFNRIMMSFLGQHYPVEGR